MAVTSTHIPLSGLARRLVTEGVLSDADALDAFKKTQEKQGSLVSFLVEKGLADSLRVAEVASMEFGVPLLDIDAMELDPKVVKLVADRLIRKHHALPLFKRGTRLFLAVSDPANLQGLNEIKFHVGAGTEAVLVDEAKLTRAIDKVLDDAHGGNAMSEMGEGDLEDLEGLEVAEDEKEQDDVEVDAPVVRFVNKCLLDAIRKGASDL
ncbi:MAG: type IV-A pilus assembly ATPase PilB, partial [Gammaproteobacteria bacterium]